MVKPVFETHMALLPSVQLERSGRKAVVLRRTVGLDERRSRPYTAQLAR